MSGTRSPQSGLTRRGFLKATGAAAGALGLAGAAGMTTADSWLAPTQAHAEPEERVGYTFHYRHCQCNCHLKCTVRDGRMVLVEPNEWPDKRNETICLKGISEIQHTYSKERLQVPLKRVGERGGASSSRSPGTRRLTPLPRRLKRPRRNTGRRPLPSKRPLTRSPRSSPSCSRAKKNPTAESISGWAMASLQRSPNRVSREPRRTR